MASSSSAAPSGSAAPAASATDAAGFSAADFFDTQTPPPTLAEHAAAVREFVERHRGKRRVVLVTVSARADESSAVPCSLGLAAHCGTPDRAECLELRLAIARASTPATRH
jgi:hypothetical protein